MSNEHPLELALAQLRAASAFASNSQLTELGSAMEECFRLIGEAFYGAREHHSPLFVDFYTAANHLVAYGMVQEELSKQPEGPLLSDSNRLPEGAIERARDLLATISQNPGSALERANALIEKISAVLHDHVREERELERLAYALFDHLLSAISASEQERTELFTEKITLFDALEKKFTQLCTGVIDAYDAELKQNFSNFLVYIAKARQLADTPQFASAKEKLGLANRSLQKISQFISAQEELVS